MAQQHSTPLTKLLGANAKKAFDAHKADDTVFDTNSRLPAGIENGIAQLSGISWGVYQTGDLKGKPFFRASGRVVAPDAHEGVPIKNLTTSIGPEPLCDTPQRKSRPKFDDHLQWVLNELRKLGLDTRSLDLEHLEAACQALVKSAPYFRFRTWIGDPTPQYPNPKTNEVWNGACDYAEGAGEPGLDDDETGDEPPTEAVADDEPTGDVEDGGIAPDAGDLDSLAERADAKKKSKDRDAAQAQLEQMAKDLGYAQDVIDNADNWAAVVEMIKAGPPADEGAEEVEEEPAEEVEEEESTGPAVGDVYRYARVDTKTKKKGKLEEYEITELTADGKAVIKALVGGTKIKVPVSALVE